MAFAWTCGPTPFFDHGLMFFSARERARLGGAGRHARLAVQQEEARLRRLFPPPPAVLVARIYGQYALRAMLGDVWNLFALATVSGSVFRIVVQYFSICLPVMFEIENPRPGGLAIPDRDESEWFVEDEEGEEESADD